MPLIPRQKKQDDAPDWLSIELDSAKDAELLREAKRMQGYVNQIESRAEGSYSYEQLAALAAAQNTIFLAHAQLLERQKIRVLQNAQKKRQASGFVQKPKI